MKIRKAENNQGIAHIKASYNNTIVTITDINGNTITWASSGTVGMNGSKRSTSYAGQLAGQEAGRKALNKDYTTVDVKVRGLGKGRISSIKGLKLSGLKIKTITDHTPIPHNGCRPRKPRRL